MSGLWPMAGYDPENSNWHPQGEALRNDPERLKSVECFTLYPPEGIRPDTPPSAVAVHDGVLYVTHDEDLIAFDFESETERWRTTFSRSGVGSDPSFTFTSPPSIGDDEIYVTAGSGVHAVDRESGNTEWTCYLLGDDAHGDDHPHGPVVTDEYVFEVSSTLLYAIERSTGSVAWRFGREPIHGRPLVNGELVIVSGSESVFGLNVTDGMLEWTATETPQSTPAETALRARSRSLTTALHRDSVITLHDADPSTMVAYDSDDGETAWTRSFDSSVRGIATTDEHVITVSKNETQHRCTVTCVSANDGDQRWVEEIEIDVSDGPTEHSSVGRPLVADDTVFVDTGWSPPVLMTDGGRSFSTFAGDGTLTALDVETGARRWRCPLGEEAFFKAVTGDRLYICGAGGTVHAFEDTGTEVYAETALNFCANCGTDLRPYDGPRYCPTCGDSLEERG